MRRRYLVCYDITDKRRLRRVHKRMKGYGDPLQYSVFRCDLSAAEKTLMLEAVLGQMKQDVDRLMVVDLGRTDSKSLAETEYFGPRPDPPADGAIII